MNLQTQTPALSMVLESAADTITSIHQLGISTASLCVGELRIDSRLVQPADIFVALPGEHVDGHAYVESVLAKKPACIVVHRDWAGLPALLGQKPNVVIAVVADQVATMAAFARAYRLHCEDVPFIAVTGSVGKTTVKTLLQHILSQFTSTLVTHASQNNHLGVPMTVSRLHSGIEVAVAELGANHLGEIALGANLVQPLVAVLTGVNSAHVEGFGSIDNTAQAKGEILDALLPNGVAVLNRDDQYFEQWVERLKPSIQLISFGRSAMADIQLLENGLCRMNKALPVKGLESELGATPIDFTFEMPLLGAHNFFNGLIALSSVIALGSTVELPWIKDFYRQRGDIFKGVEPAAGRLVPISLKNGTLLVDDTYNASPAAVSSSIQVLAEQSGERWFVFGGMAELGDDALELHEQVGLEAAQLSIDQFWAVSDSGCHAAEAYAKNYAGPIACFQTQDALNAALLAAVQAHKPGCILVKGARSKKMELIVQHLEEMIGLEEKGTE